MKFRRCTALTVLFALSCVAGCMPESRQTQAKGSSSQTQWIDPNKLHPSPIQHEQLSAEQMQRIKTLQQTFRDVDSSSLDKWVEDFKRDRDPEREIRIYEGMAEAYRAYCSGKSLTPQAKQDVYQVVLLRSGAPDSEVLPRLKLKVLSVEDAKGILKQYKAAPAPVEVSTKPGGN